MEDRLRKEIKKELEYSNKKLEEMEKLVKSLAQRKPEVNDMANKVYMIAYGEEPFYGVEMYLVGIYDTKEKANEALAECKRTKRESALNVIEVEVNKTYPTGVDERTYQHKVGSKYIGGYSE